MDDDIVDILCAAWRRVREGLRDKPDEVRRRLKRGREMWRKRPPRAWCLAVRASDTRINPVTARCEPEEAAYPRECMPGEKRTKYERHRVTLDVELLRELIRPVRIHEWGEPAVEVARRLGRGKDGVVVARVKGRLATHFHRPDATSGWRARPIVSSKGWLDPGAHLFQQADRVWGWTGKIAYWRVPDELPPQTIERVPIYHDRTRAYADKTGLHPEHPLVDPPAPRKRPNYKLAPPPPDYVPYKWKRDEYVGYAWRDAQTNPLIRVNYERHEREKARQRARWQARRARGELKPRRDEGGGGSLLFRGWMWICPICGKQKKVLYYPLPPVNVIRGYGCYVPDEVIDNALAGEPGLLDWLRAPSNAGLACCRCHRVTATSRVVPGAWNDAVTCLSGGLLYGGEVPRPAWFTRDRKRSFHPRPNAPPSRRRPQVQAMMLRGLTFKQIGRELGIGPTTVERYARELYARHGVRGRRELERKLGAGERVDA